MATGLQAGSVATGLHAELPAGVATGLHACRDDEGTSLGDDHGLLLLWVWVSSLDDDHGLLLLGVWVSLLGDDRGLLLLWVWVSIP